MSIEKDLPPMRRFITTTDSHGKATFDTSIKNEASWQSIGKVADFFLAYTTSSFPPNLDKSADIKSYQSFQDSKPGLSIKGGTVLRVVDCAPHSESPMHKTISLDYGIILEGEVDLVLDSGEKQRLKRGDMAVQRATMHGWNNPTDQWARIVFVLQEAQGMNLSEDYGVGMDGIRSSS